jgi:hypothetical protein
LVEPLHVIHETKQWLRLGDVGEQTQHGQPDQEAVRSSAASQAERRGQRVTLWARQLIEAIEIRGTQKMEAGERELHLGFDACGSSDPTTGCLAHDVIEQRSLADACITAKHEHAARAGTRILDEPL